jgi:hypothetical protein
MGIEVRGQRSDGRRRDMSRSTIILKAKAEKLTAEELEV